MKQDAIKWWNSLDPVEQRGYYLDYKETRFTPADCISNLTGREIEIIYSNTSASGDSYSGRMQDQLFDFD